MRLLKTRKSEKSICDLDGFADICNEKLRLCVGSQSCSEGNYIRPIPPLFPPYDPPPEQNPGNPSGPSGGGAK